MAIVVIITNPPCKASILGCSFIISQTHKGPIVVSKTKNNVTLYVGIYLGAKVKRANGRVTKKTHIIGIKYMSAPFR